MPVISLPAEPSLEQLRNQAKDLTVAPEMVLRNAAGPCNTYTGEEQDGFRRVFFRKPLI